jgi:hypothetical protein
MRNQLFVGEVSCQQISCRRSKNISKKQTEQQTVIIKSLCDHYTGLYVDTLTKSMKVVCLDPILHIRSEASELNEQENRKLDLENELIRSNDLNISINLQRQKNGVNHIDESEYRVHRTKVVNTDFSFDGQGSNPL